MKKYYLVGGYVYSGDGDRHYIEALRLPKLYGVPMSDCTIAPKNQQDWSMPDGLIVLRPDSSGKYELPKIKFK